MAKMPQQKKTGLSNCTTRQAIVLESCSNPQKTWQVFESTMKKKFCVSAFLLVTSQVDYF